MDRMEAPRAEVPTHGPDLIPCNCSTHLLGTLDEAGYTAGKRGYSLSFDAGHPRPAEGRKGPACRNRIADSLFIRSSRELARLLGLALP